MEKEQFKWMNTVLLHPTTDVKEWQVEIQKLRKDNAFLIELKMYML